MADHAYRDTTILIRDPVAGLWDPNRDAPPEATPPGAPVRPAQVGPYVEYVTQHLDDLRNFPPGQQLFLALTGAAPKRQILTYLGEDVINENACHGNDVGMSKKIRTAFEREDWDSARLELNRTLHAEQGANLAHDLNWFATQILVTPLPRWNPALTAATSPMNPAGYMPGTPAFNELRDVMATQLNHLKANRMKLMKDNEEHRELFDVIIYILRDRLANGPGSSSLVWYTPFKIQTSTGPRPPQCALFHELVHAMYNAQGSQLSFENSQSEVFGRHFELMSVGLPPFNNAPCSENQIRLHLHAPLRPRY